VTRTPSSLQRRLTHSVIMKISKQNVFWPRNKEIEITPNPIIGDNNVKQLQCLFDDVPTNQRLLHHSFPFKSLLDSTKEEWYFLGAFKSPPHLHFFATFSRRTQAIEQKQNPKRSSMPAVYLAGGHVVRLSGEWPLPKLQY
jgi:hypothetical protein